MKEYGLDPDNFILNSLKGEDFIIGTKTVLLHHVLIYTAPHHGYRCQPRITVFSPQDQG